jgi:beta-glucosidase
MTGGRLYEVTIEAACKFPESVVERESAHVWSLQPSIRLGYLEELPGNMISDAVDLANECDYTILVIGLNEEWESEGYDRKVMSLPGEQDKLVQTMLEKVTRPENVIVVNQSGAAVEMPWADQAHTILQAWYGGQEAGNALADVLVGETCPSGHLPFTWPQRYSDLDFSRSPATWPGIDGKVVYNEGTAVGYRGNLTNGVEPQWWFGHGLTYTSFRTSTVEVKEHHDQQCWEVVVEVENTGSCNGQHVVQVYTWPKDQHKARELKAFDKTDVLTPGATQVLKLQVNMRDMARWGEGRWVLKQNEYVLGIGQHAGAMEMVAATVRVRETLTWAP